MHDTSNTNAQNTDSGTTDSMLNKYLTFEVGNETYGVEIKYVLQIIVMQQISKMPDMPPDMQGFINLRGEVIPVTSLRLKFGLDEREYNDRTCVVVVQTGEGDNKKEYGLIVDNINETVTIMPADISDPPSTSAITMSSFVVGIMGKDGQNIMLLDVAKLFSDDLLKQNITVEDCNEEYAN